VSGEDGHLIGNEQFLGQPQQDHLKTHYHARPRRPQRTRHLRQKYGCANNRPGRQIREVTHVSSEWKQTPASCQLAAVDVDNVAERLKSEERNPERQRNRSNQEIRVLEVAEQQQIRRHGRPQPALSRPRLPAFLNPNAAEIVDRYGCG